MEEEDLVVEKERGGEGGEVLAGVGGDLAEEGGGEGGELETELGHQLNN